MDSEVNSRKCKVLNQMYSRQISGGSFTADSLTKSGCLSNRLWQFLQLNRGKLKRKLCGQLIEMIDIVRYILELNGISFRTRSSKKLYQLGNLNLIYAPHIQIFSNMKLLLCVLLFLAFTDLVTLLWKHDNYYVHAIFIASFVMS